MQDWQDGSDKLDFTAHSGVTGIGDLTITQAGTNTEISFAADTIILVGVTATDIDASDLAANGVAPVAPIELAQVELDTDDRGFVINGVSAGDRSGWSVSAAGDVNGDGLDDLIVGAFLDDPNGDDSGASFVVFGGDFSGVVTQVGTVGDDTLTDTGANDVIFAGTGNDRIDGGGGTDRLSGGAGDDVLVFQDVGGTTTVIDFEGGAGAGDRLDVAAFGFADFAALQAAASASGPGGHDTQIQLDANDSILLEDFDLASLVADDVNLV